MSDTKIEGGADALNAKLAHLRDVVRRLVQDAQKNNPHALGAWEAVSRFLYYVLDLSPESLRYIRLHTEIFNGEPVTGVVFSGAARPEDMDALYGYSTLVEGLPDSALLEEPDLMPFDHVLFADGDAPRSGQSIPMGFKINGRQISPDLVRYQGYFRNLHYLGVLAAIERHTPENRFVFLEIGAGYGSLAYQLMARNRGRMSAVIVDLPLMLIYTACYMAVNLPELNIFIYDPADPDARPDPKVHDLILVPNYRIDVLKDIGGIDLAFNSLSLQEMADTQIDEYLDFLERHVRGGFYYHGTMVMFKEGGRDVAQGITAKIAERFDINPSLEFFNGTVWKKARSGAHGWPVTIPYEFYATPKGKKHNLPEDAKIRLRLTDGSKADVSLDGKLTYPNARAAIQSKSSRWVVLAKRIAKRLLRMLEGR